MFGAEIPSYFEFTISITVVRPSSSCGLRNSPRPSAFFAHVVVFPAKAGTGRTTQVTAAILHPSGRGGKLSNEVTQRVERAQVKAGAVRRGHRRDEREGGTADGRGWWGSVFDTIGFRVHTLMKLVCARWRSPSFRSFSN